MTSDHRYEMRTLTSTVNVASERRRPATPPVVLILLAAACGGGGDGKDASVDVDALASRDARVTDAAVGVDARAGRDAPASRDGHLADASGGVDALDASVGVDALATRDATPADALTQCPALETIIEPTEQLFVAPNGVDTAAGTADAPLATLKAAAEHFPNGGTIIVAGGTYAAQSLAATGAANHPLVIRPAQGEHPIFDGSSLTASNSAVIELTSATHAVLEGLEVENGLAPDATGIAAIGPVSDLTVRGCSIHDLNGTLMRFSGDTIRLEDNELYNGALLNKNYASKGTNTGWPTCMGTAPDTAHPASPWPTNVLIRGNYVHDCWGEGIGIWFGSGVVVEDNTVEATFNVGIYLDNASNVQVERNYVHMVDGMAASGGYANGILLGVEPYLGFNPTVVSAHDITIENNVVVANGINWWDSPSTSPNNTYANVSVLHNTIISPAGWGIGFGSVASGAVTPTGCVATNNAVAETYGSYIKTANAFVFAGNAWINGTKPAIAGVTDVTATIAMPATITSGTDVEPLAAQLGPGVESGVTNDFLCAPRSATGPTRGAFEH